jgi:hypothetical protein
MMKYDFVITSFAICRWRVHIGSDVMMKYGFVTTSFAICRWRVHIGSGVMMKSVFYRQVQISPDLQPL